MSTPRILIHVRGGVAEVVATDAPIEVYLVDWDSEDPLRPFEIEMQWSSQLPDVETPERFNEILKETRREFEEAFLDDGVVVEVE